MQVLLGSQQISNGMPGVKAVWADTLDRDLLLPECQANEAHRSRLGSLSGTGKYADKGITPCLRQVISNESFQPLFHPHLESSHFSFLSPRSTLQETEAHPFNLA